MIGRPMSQNDSLRRHRHVPAMRIAAAVVAAFLCISISAAAVAESGPSPLVGSLSSGPLQVLYVGNCTLTAAVSSAVAGCMETEYRAVAVPAGTSVSGVNTADSDDPFKAPPPGGWDVIWLGTSPALLPAAIGEPLMDMVADGAGLVYAGREGDLKDFSTGGADDAPFRAAFNRDVRTDVAGRHGEGVMVALDPVAPGDRLAEERYLLATVNAMLSASRRNSGPSVIGIQLDGKEIMQESMVMMNFRMDLVNSGPAQRMNVRQRYVNRYGRVMYETAERFNVSGGRSFMLFDYPYLPAGEYSCEVVLADDNGAVSVGGASFKVTSETYLTALYPWYTGVPNGGYVHCTLALSTEILADMRFEAELVDMYGRIIDHTVPRATPGWKSSNFSLHAVDVPGRAATLRVYYWRGNQFVDTMETPVYIGKNYDPHDFSVVSGDSGIPPLFRAGSLERLAGAGVAWISSDMSPFTPERQFRRGGDILAAGAGLFPSLGDIDRVTPDAAYSAADTLRHFDPPAYLMTGATVPGERFDGIQAALVAADSTVRAGMTGLRFASADDIMRVAGTSDLVLADEPLPVTGRDMNLLASIDSLSWPDAVTGTIVRGRPDAETVRMLPWENLFAGLNSIWWGIGDDGYDTVFMPDGALTPALAALADEAGEIGGGIGRLLLGAEPSPMPDWLTVTGGAGTADDFAIRVFRDGDARYIGILPLPAAAGEAQPVTLTADFSASGPAPAVYDVRNGAYFGVSGSVTLDAVPGEAVVLALMPGQIRDVSLTGMAQVVAPGSSVTAAAGVRDRTGTVVSERHVLRVDVAGPDGHVRPYMTKLADTRDGAGEVSVFIAYNDPPGQWTLTATDIATGRHVSRGFIVRRPMTPGVVQD